MVKLGLSGGSDSKEYAYSTGDLALIPGSGRFLWRREWLPTPVFLPREFHGQGILVDPSRWGHKESEKTEQLTAATNRAKLQSMELNSCSDQIC